MSKKNNEQQPVASALQVQLRKALLHKAGPECKNKFTGEGYGEASVLWEDAECIVATVMKVCAARRANTEIVIDGAKYLANSFPQIGSGCAQMMNWNTKSWYSDVDSERDNRSFVEVQIPEYVNDSYEASNGKTKQANGKVVSPEKLKQLVEGFNGLNKKIGDHHEIKIGGTVDKEHIRFGSFNYLYVDGDIRRVSDSTDGVGAEFTTLLQPSVTFEGLVFGSPAEEVESTHLYEWLF